MLIDDHDLVLQIKNNKPIKLLLLLQKQIHHQVTEKQAEHFQE